MGARFSGAGASPAAVTGAGGSPALQGRDRRRPRLCGWGQILYHRRPKNFIYLCPYHPSSHSLMLKTLVCKGGFDGEVWAKAGHCKNIKIVAINRVK